MSGPDLEVVINEHYYDGGWRCFCGWTGSAGEWSTHLSAALHAELARWLADEGTREVVAYAVCRGMGSGVCFNYDPSVSGGCSRCEQDATAALAALTTTDQEDHR